MLKQLIAGIVIAGLSSSVLADHRGDRFDRGHGKPHRGGQTDYARVVDVEPITETLTHRIPRETCWNEQVRYEEPVGGRDSATPVILGGIIGAAIGSSLGNNHHKSNRTIKTVALGALGASIGNDIARRSHPGATRVDYRTEEHCEVSYDTQYEERIRGYDVTYKYRGETYRTRMDYDPGKRIKVNVKVRPVM
ncbi:glycine zipper 2TM domain-containing protein [Motiliproteus sp. SC1-56]|uniref:glycine zipper 2TM domain-containing protein n=1 Tax=Motiliproteus sp. SC1-56 TaxID=2799565 RepID=UPI001A8E2F89|nr:hypothetical protein [Motiliproteus sp. SC1-56]